MMDRVKISNENWYYVILKVMLAGLKDMVLYIATPIGSATTC